MAIVRLEGLGQLKNPMNSSGIEPATFRYVMHNRSNRYPTSNFPFSSALVFINLVGLRINPHFIVHTGIIHLGNLIPNFQALCSVMYGTVASVDA
jgi:hypothetical protein